MQQKTAKKISIKLREIPLLNSSYQNKFRKYKIPPLVLLCLVKFWISNHFLFQLPRQI